MLPKLQPQKDIVVDGQKYVVQLYPPTVGLVLYAKLLRLLGEPIVKFIGSFGKDAFKKEAIKLDLDGVDFEVVGQALSSLLSKIGDDDVVPLIQEILHGTFVYETKTAVNEQFETLFMGRYNHVFKLVAKTIGAQYPDFLSVLGKRASAAKLASASTEMKAAES